MDFHGNNVHQVGFANPDVVEAIKSQLDELPFCTRRYTNRVAVDLAQQIVRNNTGGPRQGAALPRRHGAIGMAMKLARIATGRHKFISMWDAFHGASLDAISVGGEAVFRAGVGPLLPGCEHVPPADAYRCLWDCTDARRLRFEMRGLPGIRARARARRGGSYRRAGSQHALHSAAGILAGRTAACDRHGTLLIFDEICHGLGRTGRMFTCEHFGVTPDILVIGKGLGGGVMPLAAMIARPGLDVAADRALGHYTHEKSPVACAAAPWPRSATSKSTSWSITPASSASGPCGRYAV